MEERRKCRGRNNDRRRYTDEKRVNGKRRRGGGAEKEGEKYVGVEKRRKSRKRNNGKGRRYKDKERGIKCYSKIFPTDKCVCVGGGDSKGGWKAELKIRDIGLKMCDDVDDGEGKRGGR